MPEQRIAHGCAQSSRRWVDNDRRRLAIAAAQVPVELDLHIAGDVSLVRRGVLLRGCDCVAVPFDPDGAREFRCEALREKSGTRVGIDQQFAGLATASRRAAPSLRRLRRSFARKRGDQRGRAMCSGHRAACAREVRQAVHSPPAPQSGNVPRRSAHAHRAGSSRSCRFGVNRDAIAIPVVAWARG